MKTSLGAFTILFALQVPALSADETDLGMVTKIRLEATLNSKVSETLSYLSDVSGPRLSGSPGIARAQEWALRRLAEWGLANATLERWGEFGRGWSVNKVSVEMTKPYYMPLLGYPKAWSRGTDGVRSGIPMLVTIRNESDFEGYRGKLKDAIVMIRPEQVAEVDFEPEAKRYSDRDLEELTQLDLGARRRRFGDRVREYRARREFRNKLGKFFLDEGVSLIVEAGRGGHGTVFVQSGGSYKMDEELGMPAIVLANEHFGLLKRLLDHEMTPEVAVQVEVSATESPVAGYNVVAEIPGSDANLKDQVVMLGGHLDSWHTGTGVTDNATGCAVSMEVVRILQAIGVRPRRTIRIALWDAEEQGFLGSRNYAKTHFGTPKDTELKAEQGKISAYFNLDNGAGRIRGIYLQGNDAVRPIFEDYLKPLHDLGATTVTLANTGGTDHLTFDALGIPAFQFIQDPLSYDTLTHHSNMDVFEQAIEEDLQQAAVVMATFVYHTANRDELLPRKPRVASEQSSAMANWD